VATLAPVRAKWGWVVAVVVVALAAATGATGASNLPPALLTLQTADLPGAQLTSQGPVHEKNYVAAYQRTFTFKSPSGSSGIRYVQSEALVAATVARAATALSQVRAAFASKAGRAAFAAEVAKSLKVKQSAVKLAALRSPRVGDHAAELPLSVQMANGRIYESVLYLQLERAVGVFVIAGIRPIAAADSRRLAAAVVKHLDAALTPVAYEVPAITGNPEQGQTLTANTGSWSTIATFSYQWQRCDETAGNCLDIPNATSRTYAIDAPDVDFALRVRVTAANRFGTAVANSALTPKVTPLPDPGVQ
jgi:hypothetical protein